MRARNPESGYTLLLLVATVTVMLITMGVGVPFWRYVIRDDREQELVFRGGEIADAIAEYQKKNANAAPVTLEVLVKMKFLRRLYKDPMTPDGEWRLVRQADVARPRQPQRQNAGSAQRRPGGGATPENTDARPGTLRSGQKGKAGTLGPIVGVASLSKEKSLRVFNGKTTYDQWLFVAGQPRDVSGIRTGPGGPQATAATGQPVPGAGGAVPGGIRPGRQGAPRDVKKPGR